MPWHVQNSKIGSSKNAATCNGACHTKLKNLVMLRMSWHEGLDAAACDKTTDKGVQAKLRMLRHTPLNVAACDKSQIHMKFTFIYLVFCIVYHLFWAF